MPHVSVIVPVYKVERFIAEAIGSVLDQTFTDFELILVDDGSPDGSADVCRRFTDARLVLLRQENRGLAGARNTGIRRARGAYLAFLDGDDRWAPTKLERHVAHLEANPRIGMSFSHSALIDEAGRPLGKAQTPPAGTVTQERLLLNNPVGNGSTPVLRRQTLADVGFEDDVHGAVERCYFDERFRRAQGVEDLDCWLRIAAQTSWEIACLPEVLTCYRMNGSGLSANGLEMLRSWEQMLDKARGYAPDLVRRMEHPARACLLRYLAGRAVRARDGEGAVRLIHRALGADVALLWERPRATWLTLLAAYALRVLPRSLFGRLEALAVPRA